MNSSSEPIRTEASGATRPTRSVGGWILATGVCLLALLYTLAVTTGRIPSAQKIDATNLVILGLAVLIAILLINPEALDRLKRLKLGSFELEVEKIKRQQEQQKSQLDAINLLLPLVLPKEEAQNLRILADNQTKDYKGSHLNRTVLRGLAAVGLIARARDRKISEIRDNKSVDLADYVRLTPFGERMVAQLKEIEMANADQRNEKVA